MVFLIMLMLLSSGDDDEASVAAIPDSEQVIAARDLAALRARLAPDDAEGHFQLALCAEKNGLRTESKRLLRATIRIDPDHVAARAKRGATTPYAMRRDGPCDVTYFPAPGYVPPFGFLRHGVGALHEIPLEAAGDITPHGVTHVLGEVPAPAPQLLLVGATPHWETLGPVRASSWLALELVLPLTVRVLGLVQRGPFAHRIMLPADPALSAFPSLFLPVIGGSGDRWITSTGLRWVVRW